MNTDTQRLHQRITENKQNRHCNKPNVNENNKN